MASISFGALPCRKKKLDDSSRLDFVEIARVPHMLPSLFLSWSDQGLISSPGSNNIKTSETIDIGENRTTGMSSLCIAAT